MIRIVLGLFSYQNGAVEKGICFAVEEELSAGATEAEALQVLEKVGIIIITLMCLNNYSITMFTIIL